MLVGATDFSHLINVQTSSLLYSGYQGSFLVVKQLECEVNHLSPSSARVRIEWRCASIPLSCLHSMGRDNFTFIFVGLYHLFSVLSYF